MKLPVAGPVIFDPEASATPRLRRMLTRGAAQNRYAVFFTPRSGSSWLTGIVEQSDRLGCATEVFNPNFCRRHAQRHGIASLDQYIDYVMRRDNRGGVFGFEITANHIHRTFGDPARFKQHFVADPAFWLIRQDIVAQAVSLAKMAATNVAQSVAASAEQRAAADAAFVYERLAIRKSLMRIMSMERLSESWFAEWGLRPLRMSYEQITALTPHQMLNVIARHAGRPDVPPVDIQPRHEKLGTARNTDYAQRFRDEQADWLAPIAAERAVWLDKLDDVAGMVRDI
ncbi:Stf0 family sulfotransferase [Rhodophyticola sp.]|uniref:Stf0 family sulfotransferase n=1 Tax=Rhodophyticola sp. TaxID=2680032 RepID=UPI003D2A66F3